MFFLGKFESEPQELLLFINGLDEKTDQCGLWKHKEFSEFFSKCGKTRNSLHSVEISLFFYHSDLRGINFGGSGKMPFLPF